MYWLVDEINVVHNLVKEVPWSVVIDGERMSVKNIDLYKHVLEAEIKWDAVINITFILSNNQEFATWIKEQNKTLMTYTDNKRRILGNILHTLAFGHY